MKGDQRQHAARLLRPIGLVAFLWLLLAVATADGTTSPNSAAPVNLIIDTDIGSDFDDTWALFYALTARLHSNTNSTSLPAFRVRLVLTSTGNTTGRALLAAWLLHALNQTNVEVGIGLNGAPDPRWNNAQDGYGVGPQFPWVPSPHAFPPADAANVSRDGISRAIELIEEETKKESPHLDDGRETSSSSWIILSIAAMTNVAEIFHRRPDLASKVSIVTMSGTIYGVPDTFPLLPNGNIWRNISAARSVYNWQKKKSDSGNSSRTTTIPWRGPICACPTDASFFFQIYGDNFARLRHCASRNSSTKFARILLDNFAIWRAHGGGQYPMYRPCDVNTTSSTAWDLLAAYQAVNLAQSLIDRRLSSTGNHSSSTRPSCSRSKYLVMERLPIHLDRFGLTLVVKNDTSAVVVDESVGFIGGNHNGSFPIGAVIVDSLCG